MLLQLRVEWSHFGGTWGLPGGARKAGETPEQAAIREADEEASVPPDAVEVLATRVFDVGYWSYTTVLAKASRLFEPAMGDAESSDLRWVPFAEVAGAAAASRRRGGVAGAARRANGSRRGAGRRDRRLARAHRRVSR